MHIYGKNPLKIFFSGLERSKILILGIPYQIDSNGDHWLTLTYIEYEK